MPMYEKVSGAWKEITQPGEKVSGAWKNTVAAFEKVSGTWKQFYTALTLNLGATQLSATTTNPTTASLRWYTDGVLAGRVNTGSWLTKKNWCDPASAVADLEIRFTNLAGDVSNFSTNGVTEDAWQDADQAGGMVLTLEDTQTITDPKLVTFDVQVRAKGGSTILGDASCSMTADYSL